VLYVVDQLRPRFEFALSTFEQGRDLAGTDPILQAKLIKQLMHNLLQFFLGSPDIPHFIPFVLREFFVPGKYFSIFYEALPRHLHELFTQMVAMVEGTDPEAERTIIRAHSLLGQIMIFHVGRPVLFKRLGWQEFNPARIETITREIQSLVLRALQLADPDDQGMDDDT
ncbi:MAG: CerR family C-terminal domain-containing protein, partial [Pseudomonadales bacterium]